jgi:hypothetical protein
VSDSIRKAHLTEDEVAAYCERRLTEDAEYEIEEHLAGCEECAKKARTGLRFSFVWDRWTARAHGQAAQLARVHAAFARLQRNTKYALWQARLRDWIDRWQGRGEAVLGVLMGKACRFVVDGQEALVRTGSTLQFAYETRAAGRKSHASLTVIRTKGSNDATVRINPRERKVTVSLSHRQIGKVPPLVALIPEDKGKWPRLGEVKLDVSNPGFYSVQFTNVPAGKHTLLIEPMEQSESARHH